MDVIRNRAGRVVACFAHPSDAAIYLADHGNAARGYAVSDEPGLDSQIQHLVDAPRVDGRVSCEHWTRPEATRPDAYG